MIKIKLKIFSLYPKIILAIVSFLGYYLLTNWKISLFLMLAVGIHECGHVWAMNKMKLENNGFYFIPFIGGVAINKDEYKSYLQKIFVSIMGPLWGAIMSLACVFIYILTGNVLFATSAILVAGFNLFNMLPLYPLDGGQIVKTISVSINKNVGFIFQILSIALSIIMFLIFKYAMLFIIMFYGIMDFIHDFYYNYKMQDPLYPKWKIPAKILNDDIIKFSKKELIISAISYVVLIVVLALIILIMKTIPGATVFNNFLR